MVLIQHSLLMVGVWVERRPHQHITPDNSNCLHTFADVMERKSTAGCPMAPPRSSSTHSTLHF